MCQKRKMIDLKTWTEDAVAKAGDWTKSAGGALLENAGDFIDKAGNWTETTGGVLIENAGDFFGKAGNWTESAGRALLENAGIMSAKPETGLNTLEERF
jgi:hypothetical protein